MADNIEPLEPALWFDRIEMIARGQVGGIENSLRHAGHLLQLTPTSFREVVHMSLDVDSYEALLEAARNLIAQPTALSVELDSKGPVQAVISCVILNRAIRGEGDTVATAVLAAWTTCLLALRTEFGADLVSLGDELGHKGQSGRHRPSAWH